MLREVFFGVLFHAVVSAHGSNSRITPDASGRSPSADGVSASRGGIVLAGLAQMFLSAASVTATGTWQSLVSSTVFCLCDAMICVLGWVCVCSFPWLCVFICLSVCRLGSLFA